MILDFVFSSDDFFVCMFLFLLDISVILFNLSEIFIHLLVDFGDLVDNFS